MKDEAEVAIASANSPDALEELRILYLGRKGKVAGLFEVMAKLPVTEKPKFGAELNSLKKFIESGLDSKKNSLTSGAKRSNMDVTEPGLDIKLGSLHPITQTEQEIVNIFTRLGFSVATGPEIETDWYNFEALNIPPDHPARDTQDTFYLSIDSRQASGSPEMLLRTHTSPVQIRVMESTKPPIRVIIPGRVYRRDLDPTHTPMFNQVEGLVVDKSANFAELKGTLKYFVHQFYGSGTKLRFRPHHFPFTEPSAEIDISCTICKGTGEVDNAICRVCKGTTWLEVLGAGMVHPNVLKNAGLDPKVYRGFAFGTGIDRNAMLKYSIPDLRLMFENDLRFLEQF